MGARVVHHKSALVTKPDDFICFAIWFHEALLHFHIYIKAQQQRKHHLKMYPFCCLLMRMHILNRNRILTLEWPTMTICLEISVMQIRHSSFPPTRCVISMEATIRNTYEKRYSKSICCTSHRMRQLASAKNSPDSFWLIDWRCNIFNVIKCLRLSIFNLDNWL